MRIATSFLTALLLIGSLGAGNSFAVADGVISNATDASGIYCHLRFPMIREDTLYSDHPVLKHPNDGDIIDYYGPCDHDPLGKEEILYQRRQNADLYEND